MENQIYLVLLSLLMVNPHYCRSHNNYERLYDPDFDHTCSDISECVCTLSGSDYIAECANPDLDHIPDNLPYNITVLSVTDSAITTLTDQDLSYIYLRTLDLSRNALTSISPGAFDHLLDLEEVKLNHNSLQDIPETILLQNPLLTKFHAHFNTLQAMPKLTNLVHLEEVRLENNLIESILVDDFQRSSGIKSFSLASNKISIVLANTFQSQVNLVHLDLSDNEIVTLHENSFQGLTSLTEIWLRGNNLQNIPYGILQYSTELLYLDISENAIETIEDSAFFNLGKLISIDLSGNKLTGVPNSLNSLAELRTLYLNENLLGTVGPRAFSGLTYIEELFLGGMETLTEISINAFEGLMQLTTLSLSNNPNLHAFTPDHLPALEHPNIQYIYLYGNRFTYLDENIFLDKLSLQQVDLYNNTFNCSCDLKWMPRVVEEGKVWAQHWAVSSTPPRCFTPIHLFDWPIPQMTQEDMTCEELNIVRISPPSRTVHLKEEMNFTAQLYKGLPSSKWYVPGTAEPIIPFPAGDHPLNLRRYATWKLLENNVIEATLFLDNASLPDAGDYTLVATNIKGDKSMTFDLDVLPYELTTTTIRWETTGYVGQANSTAEIQGLVLLILTLLAFELRGV